MTTNLTSLRPIGADAPSRRWRPWLFFAAVAALAATVFGYVYRSLDGAWSRVGTAAYEAGLAAGAARTDRELWATESAPLVICGRWDRLESRDAAPAGSVLVLMQETPTSGVYLACWPQVGHAKETE